MSFLTLNTDSNKKFVLYGNTGKWALTNNVNEEVKKELTKPYFKKRFRGTRLVVLNIGRQCNLDCNYCHVGDLKKENEVMSYKVGKKAIDRVLELDENNRRIVFHGSEPLMNFGVIKKIVDYSNKKTKTIDFSMQTNGTLLDNENLGYMKKNKVSIGISLDGLKTHQDFNRPYRSGGSSYMDVVNNVEKTKDVQGGISVISVVTKYNVDDLLSIAKDFTRKGIDSVLFSPVSSTDNSNIAPNPKVLTKNMLTLFDEYIFNIADSIKSVKIRNFRDALRTFFMDKITTNCVKCGGDDLHPLIAIDVNGSIYPCDFFWSRQEYSMGNIFDTSLNDAINSPKNMRVSRNLNGLESCIKCDWKMFCGSGCPGGSMKNGKGISAKNPYCYYSKKILEYTAKKIPFLHENRLIGKILD